MDKTLLQKAIDSIKSGDRQGGKTILDDLVKQDPNNEIAWFWLAAV